VNDIVITKIVESHQAVAVLAGDGYVALEVDFQDEPDAQQSRLPHAVVLLSLAGAERMRYALGSAVIKATQALNVAMSMVGSR